MPDDNDSIYNTQVYNVTFEATARTRRYSQSGGQLLLVSDGKYYSPEKGKTARLLNRGNTVTTPPKCYYTGMEHFFDYFLKVLTKR